MAKVMEIKDLAERTVARITSSEEEFRRFMDTASRLPMHPVQDQVLIYAQRPEAEMVFSYEDWKKKGKCHVNRGAKGIALISENRYGGAVRYVFCDRSVTPYNGGKLPKKWFFTEEKSPEVFSRLEEKYGATEAEAATAERLIEILEKECDAWLEAKISPAQRQDFGRLLKTMAIYLYHAPQNGNRPGRGERAL